MLISLSNVHHWSFCPKWSSVPMFN